MHNYYSAKLIEGKYSFCGSPQVPSYSITPFSSQLGTSKFSYYVATLLPWCSVQKSVRSAYLMSAVAAVVTVEVSASYIQHWQLKFNCKVWFCLNYPHNAAMQMVYEGRVYKAACMRSHGVRMSM